MLTLRIGLFSPARCLASLSPLRNAPRLRRISLASSLFVSGAALALTVSPTTSPLTNIYCDELPAEAPQSPVAPGPKPPARPPPESIVNVYELSFGTLAGICAGVFIKKGAKMVAFFVGGIFVLLQYFNSLSLIRIDWARVNDRFENLFYSTDATGARKPPSLASLWRWLVDFLAADFQPRATFIAGLLLGLRVG